MQLQFTAPTNLENITWLAPAKINLFLRITGRRADGMHELQTAFQFVDLCDELRFKLRDDGVIERSDPIEAVSPDQDLTLRAAKLLQQESESSLGATISLLKHIPMGGGLGGASSDAATVLLVLNQAWALGFTIDELADLGQSLGADVPVFVRGHAAWAEGIGEQLLPITLSERHYVIARTPDPVNTGEMFADSQLTRNCPKLTICDPEREGLGNVFEPIVRSRYPAIDAVFIWLNNFSTPFLTGSGGCVVAPVADLHTAQQIQSEAPAGVTVFTVMSKNISPLYAQC